MQGVGRKLRKFADLILRIMYPPKCSGCNEILDYYTEGIFCEECKRKFTELKNGICAKCGQPIPKCWCGVGGNAGEVIDGEVHLVQYDKGVEVVKTLIYNCKRVTCMPYFKGIAKEFADELYPRLPKHEYTVTAIPRSRTAKLINGHDQSVLIASEFCKLTSLEYISVLYHVGNKRQKTLSRSERRVNAEHSYKIKNGISPLVKGKSIILIDDVVTTGSSAVRCAKLLKSKGAKRVYLMCIAKTV